MESLQQNHRPDEYVLTRKGKVQLKNAKHIKQLNPNFSRLYNAPKEYDHLRYRKKVNGKLKAIGMKDYYAQNNTPDEIMYELINIHKRTDYYVGCSGGKDSICLAHYIATNYPENFKGLVFIDTGVGIQQTQHWLIGYAEANNWPLKIIKSFPRTEEQSKYKSQYEWFVLHYGFPGPGSHGVVMGNLKYLAFKTFVKNLPNAKDVAIISGTRKFESHRRSITTKPMLQDGRLFFCSPFYAKTDEQVYKYLLDNKLRRTPVHDVLGMSGECMCGCYAQPGEREIIKKLDPELDEYLSNLEKRITDEGSHQAKYYPKWGKGRTDPFQQSLDPHLEAMVCGQDCGSGTMRGTEY